jgi:hypothetical protein
LVFFYNYFPPLFSTPLHPPPPSFLLSFRLALPQLLLLPVNLLTLHP